MKIYKSNPVKKTMTIKVSKDNPLAVDGNPLEDLSVLGASPRWFDAEPRGEGHTGIKLIMKDGKTYKNTL